VRLTLLSNQCSENTTTDSPNRNRDYPLADFNCNSDSTTSVHTQASGQDATQGPDSDGEEHDDAQTMDSSEFPSENATDISSASDEDGNESDMQMVVFLRCKYVFS
jgi:hypothetical protein